MAIGSGPAVPGLQRSRPRRPRPGPQLPLLGWPGAGRGVQVTAPQAFPAGSPGWVPVQCPPACRHRPDTYRFVCPVRCCLAIFLCPYALLAHRWRGYAAVCTQPWSHARHLFPVAKPLLCVEARALGVRTQGSFPRDGVCTQTRAQENPGQRVPHRLVLWAGALQWGWGQEGGRGVAAGHNLCLFPGSSLIAKLWKAHPPDPLIAAGSLQVEGCHGENGNQQEAFWLGDAHGRPHTCSCRPWCIHGSLRVCC